MERVDLATRLEAGGTLLLDGGFSTALEASGHELDPLLWSAAMPLDAPDAVSRVHEAYLRAGADVITTASYQLSRSGFERAGRADVEEAIEASSRLALEARSRLRPSAWVAASIGPFGAALADGSEYVGRYGVSKAELEDFHADRWRTLSASGVDVLGCETLPDIDEVDVLAGLVERTPGVRAWFSFTCQDDRHMADGTPLRIAVDRCAEVDGIVAIGVNCVPPALVPSVLAHLRASTDRPLIVYPNSGEVWDARTKRWRDVGAGHAIWLRTMQDVMSSGASIVGGCCRTTPELIAHLRAAIDEPVASGDEA